MRNFSAFTLPLMFASLGCVLLWAGFSFSPRTNAPGGPIAGPWSPAEATVIASEISPANNPADSEQKLVQAQISFVVGGKEERAVIDSNPCFGAACDELKLEMAAGKKLPVYFRRIREDGAATTATDQIEATTLPPAEDKIYFIFGLAALNFAATGFFVYRNAGRRPRLFHVSEESTIEIFHPRTVTAPATMTGDAVWAVDGAHVGNYLLPRECPRVTFLGPDGKRVIAAEEGWRERIKSCRLYLYEFKPKNFKCTDRGAGDYISRQSETPHAITTVKDVEEALRSIGTELRFLPDLWPLHDEIAKSKFEFSMIRMRNAQPRV